jgi:hypothetical protein
MLSINTIEKILNASFIKKHHPEVKFIKVFKSRKGLSIGVKYTSNDFKISPKESEKLKISIKDSLNVASFDTTFINITYFRFFDRESEV